MDWKDGGDKPLAMARKCALCGEMIPYKTRDYAYAWAEKGGYQHAHMLCVAKEAAEEYNKPENADVKAVDVADIVEAIESLDISVQAIGGLLEALVKVVRDDNLPEGAK